MFQECESTLRPEEKQQCTMEGDRRPIEDQQQGALEERYGLENELQPPLGVPESVQKQRGFQKSRHELTREQHGPLVTKEQHGTLPCDWAPVNVEKCGPLDQLEGPMVGCPVSVEGFQEIACAHNYTLSVVQAVAVPMEQDQRIKLLSPSSMKKELHWSHEAGPEHIQKREEVLVGYQGSAEESEASVAVIPGPNSEMEGTRVGAIPRLRDEAPVSLEGQAACDCYAEEPVLPAPAQPAPNSPEKAKTEFECLFLEPTVSVMMQDTDTDASEELDELENVLDDKKRKKKKRYVPRKKKKKSEPPDNAAISWLEELPFSNTDIGKLFGTPQHQNPESEAKKKHQTEERSEASPDCCSDRLQEEREREREIPRESGKSTKKRMKEQALKESKKKEKEASPNYFISLPITNPKIVADIEMIQNTVIKKDDRLSRAMIPQGTLHITLFVMHLASEDDVCSAINALSESKGAIEEILEGKHLVLSFEGVADFRNQVIFAKLAGEDTTRNNLIVMRETLQRKFKEKGIPVKEDKGFTPHLTFLKLSRSPKLRRRGLKKVDIQLYEEFSNHYFGEDSLTSLDLCSMQKKRQPSGYYHCESSIGFGPMPQKIPGTSQPNSMSPADEEDLIDSPSFHESVGARSTSFSDHTNNSVSNGRNPFLISGHAMEAEGQGGSQEEEEFHLREKGGSSLKNMTTKAVLENQSKIEGQQQIDEQDTRIFPLKTTIDLVPLVQHSDTLFQCKMLSSFMKPFLLAPSFTEAQSTQSTFKEGGDPAIVGMRELSQLNGDRGETVTQVTKGKKESSFTGPSLSSKPSVPLKTYPISASTHKKSKKRRVGRRLPSRISTYSQPLTLSDLIILEKQRMKAQQAYWECNETRMSLLEKRLANVQEEQKCATKSMQEIRTEVVLISQMLGRLMEIFEQPVGTSSVFQVVPKTEGRETIVHHVCGPRDIGETLPYIASPQEDSSEVDPFPSQRGPKKKKRRSRKPSDILPIS